MSFIFAIIALMVIALVACVLTLIIIECYCYATKKGMCPTEEEQKEAVDGLARCVQTVKSL